MMLPLPDPALPLEARIVEPVIVRRVLLPARVIEIVPAPSVERTQSPASSPRPGSGLAQHPGIRI